MSAVTDSPPDRPERADASSVVGPCLQLGQVLFSFGATAQRVLDSVTRLARSVGCQVDALVSYDALIITVDDGRTFRTRIDSSRRGSGLDLLGLARVSELIHALPSSRNGLQEFTRILHSISAGPPIHGFGVRAAAAGCAGLGFCIVNGGDPASWICSFAAALVIFVMRGALATRGFNVQLTVFAVALAGGLLAGLLTCLVQTATPVVAVVAPVLFLVPGAPMINGGIDIVRNHLSLGIARLGYTMAVIISLCLGVGAAVRLVPLPMNSGFLLPYPWDIVLYSVAGALAAGALACLHNGGLSLIVVCAAGGLVGRLVRALMGVAGLDMISSSLIAVLCSTLLVTFIAERFRWPAVVASVMAALPMVPGSFAMTGIHSLMSFAAGGHADPILLTNALQALARALFISIALVVGVIGPVVIFQRGTERV
jgi:uncharacterized membrane protein YjjP (DUF1212 family)